MDTDFPLLPADEPPALSPFDSIRHETEEGNEYWSARELALVLGYRRWAEFRKAVFKAQVACATSGQAVADHFRVATQLVPVRTGGQRAVEDYHLSRYACYLLVQNADPAKPIVALGQTYFAVQTRRQELADALEQDALAAMPEAQRRLFIRRQLTDHNTKLAAAAQEAGIINPDDFATFQDHGYMGLYAGERARDIHRRKGLNPQQRILDYMGSDELVANLFRASVTRQRLEREQIQGQPAANATHYEVGQAVREFLAEQGATMPEDLPTPAVGYPQLEQQERRRLLQEQDRQAQLEAGQQTLFEE